MAKHKGDMLEALRATLREAREEADSGEAGDLSLPQSGARERTNALAPKREVPEAERPAIAPAAEPPAARPVQRELDEIDRRIAAAQDEAPRTGPLLLQGLALIVAFLLGRWTSSGPVVSADEGESDSSEVARGPGEEAARVESPMVTRGETTRATRSEVLQRLPGSALLAPSADPAKDDEAFLNPANTHAILAIQWADNADNLHLAWAAYDSLRGRGLPAISPLKYRRQLMLFVGAAPGGEVFREGLLGQVRAAPGPNGRLKDYETAYVVTIDQYR